MDHMDNDKIVSFIDNIIGGICVLEIEGQDIRPVFLNDGFYRMLGYTKSEAQLFLRNIRLSIIPEDMPVVEQGITDILKDDGAAEFEFRTVNGSGGIRWLQVRGNLYERKGSVRTVVCLVLDCTERKEIEQSLKAQLSMINVLTDADNEFIFEYNARTDVYTLKANEKFGLFKDLIIKDFFSHPDMDRIHPDDRKMFMEINRQLLAAPGTKIFEYRVDFLCPDGRYEWHRGIITSIADQNGYVTNMIGRVKNIQESKEREINLTLRADQDPLTGILNKGATKALIINSLDSYIATDRKAALIMIDIDNFKSVNDNFGHSIGDEVIVHVAKSIMAQFKGKDVVGRVGGDEFMIFMQDIKFPGDAEGLSNSILTNIRKPYTSDGIIVNITLSIGIAVCPINGTDYETLYEKADRALYYTKENGKNGFTVYNDNMK